MTIEKIHWISFSSLIFRYTNQINKLLNLLFKMKFKITLMLKLESQMANYLEPGIMCIL